MSVNESVKNGYTDVQCNTAYDFLYELDIIRDRWSGGTWIFRGQSNSCWSLLPSACRKGGYVDRLTTKFLEHHTWTMDGGPLSEEKEREIYYEAHSILGHNIVEIFAMESSRSGFQIPYARNASNMFYKANREKSLYQQVLRNMKYKEKSYYPMNSIETALAQHHGIPTKILDWTYNPYIGAFFATYSHNGQDTILKHISVWCVKTDILDNIDLNLTNHYPSDIGFMHLQDGCFMYNHKDKSDFLESGQWKSFDVKLKDAGPKTNESVFKFSLPYSERNSLIKLLLLKGFSRRSLMPTFSNVARDILDYDIEPRDWEKKTIDVFRPER